MKNSGKHGPGRLAYVPLFMSLVAGQDRSSDKGLAGADAPCLHPDDDECLWTGNAIIETGSEWEGREMVLKPMLASA